MHVALPPRSRSLSFRRSAAFGALVWLPAVLWLLPSWGAAMLLLAALVVVPLGLALIQREDGGAHARLWTLLRWLPMPGAVLLVGSFAVPPGLAAGLLAAPWCIVTGLIGLLGLLRRWPRGLGDVAGLCFDAGLIYLPVGGGWAVLARLGVRPLEFSDVIVQATAVHFHYAGFVLPLLTGLAARELSARWTAFGVVVAVPLVAVGITWSKLSGAYGGFELAVAWLMAASGLGAAIMQLRLAVNWSPWPARWLGGISSVALFAGMVLAAVYALGMVTGAEWLDIPTMLPWHGATNALGYGLLGLLAWNGRFTGPSIDDRGENRHC